MLVGADALIEQAFERALEAAVVPEQWPDALEAIAMAADAGGAVLLSADETGGMVATESLAGAIAEFAASGGTIVNTRMERGLRLIRGGWRGLVADQHIYSDRELHEDGFQQLMHRHGFRHFVGQFVYRSEHAQVVLSLERRLPASAYSPAELARLEHLYRWLRGAGRLAAEMGFRQTGGMIDGFSLLSVPALLLGSDGRIIRMNEAAEPLVGDVITVVSGRPAAMVRSGNGSLQDGIDRAMSGRIVGDGQAVVLQRRRGGRPVIADFIPLSRGARDLFSAGTAIMLMTDVAAPARTPAQSLKLLFGLTGRETSLLATLADGSDVRDAAERLGITVNTARVHLRSVFAKTDTSRQAELLALVAQIARSAPTRAGGDPVLSPPPIKKAS